MSETKQYPNAGPGCDLGRYRTGEVPMVGDVVKTHGNGVGCHAGHHLGKTRDVTHTVIGWSTAAPNEIRVGTEGWSYFPARFDLISRAVPDKVEPSSAEESETANIFHRIEVSGAPEPPVDCSGIIAEADALIESAGKRAIKTSPAAVITGPGKYRTVAYDRGEECMIAEIKASGEMGVWFGTINCYSGLWHQSGGVSLVGWSEDTDAVGIKAIFSDYRITGRYVEPPKPVLTITHEHNCNGWTLGWSSLAEESRTIEGVMCISILSECFGRISDGVLYVKRGAGPFLCRSEHWPRVQELVAKVNAASC